MRKGNRALEGMAGPIHFCVVLLAFLCVASSLLLSPEPPSDVLAASGCSRKDAAAQCAVPGSSVQDNSRAKDRARPPRVVHSSDGAPKAVSRVQARRSEEPRDRAVDWWPFQLKPPFGRLSREQARDPEAILTGNASFLIRQGPPPIPIELTDPRPLHAGGGYYLVHLRAPLPMDAIKQLRRAGVHPLRYVPRNSYLMKIPPSGLAAISSFATPGGVFRYEPAYKISPSIGRKPLSAKTLARRGSGNLHVRLSVFPGEEPPEIADQLQALGAEILFISARSPLDPGLLPDGRTKAPRPAYVDIRLPFAVARRILPEAARIQGVRWIEEMGEFRVMSDWTVSGWDYGDSRSAGSDFLAVRQPWNNGLHGEGILLGNVDSGIDFDHTYLAAPAVPAVAQESPATQACPGGGPENSPKVPYYHLGPPVGSLTPVCYDQSSETGNPDLFGHGTATTGLIGADPTASDNTTIDLSSGTAPEAQIWMYDVGPASGIDLALSPADLSDEFGRMGQAGVSAVNLSFVNSTTDGEYDFLAELLDEAAWNQPGLLPVQAAGNDGANSGPKNDESIDSTGKNVLTVGGNLDSSPNDLYSFSARGPTVDGRYKPDVISPASNPQHLANPNPDLDETLLLLSSDGNINSSNGGLLEGPEGTSFSSASVTGLAGVVAQYFKDGFYPTGVAATADAFTPGNDLIKGTLINSGLRMTGSGITSDARPGKDQGWGRTKVNDPLYFSADPTTGQDARRLVVFEGSFPQGATTCPGDSEIFTFDLFNIEEDLRITLTWTDFPGDHSSPFAPQLVNDLDLIVTDPNLTVYYGNVFDDTGTGYSTSGGAEDRANTVENVWLPAGESLPTGLYTVEVCPFAINDGARQDFSLVITGGLRAGEKAQFEQLGYSCQDTVGIEVLDLSLPGPPINVAVSSLTTGDSETLSLPASGATGLYFGTIQTASGPASLDDGILQVADGESIEATYLASTSQSLIECSPQVCYAEDLGPIFQHECDHDGFADNGEVIHLYIPIRNSEAFPLDNTTATLTSSNSNVNVISGVASYGTIPPATVGLPDADGTDDPFVISISGAACDEPATLTLTVIQGSGWSSSACSTSNLDLQLNRDPFPLQVYDFDDGSPQGWTHVMSHGSTPSRECLETYFDVWNTFPTTVHSQSGSYSMQLGDGSYPTMVDASLVSPSLDVPSGGARLRFYYWMDADIYDSVQVWHGFIVEAKPTSGGSWTQLTPVGGYNAMAARDDCAYFFPFANTDPDLLDMFGGDGNGSAYSGDLFDQEYVVDLSPYASQTIQVRFRFGSDDYPSTAEGLYIDTITLEGFQCEAPNVCDDGEPCTTDSCDPDAGGCAYVTDSDGTPCDDGEVCTTPDQCLAGICTGPDAISCDDSDVCTDDWAEDDGDASCDNPSTDCRHQYNSQPCDDGNACTTEDICSAGSCTGGPALSCDDLNPCTDDSCTPATGCVHTNNTAPCGDGFSCTVGDVCSGGQCVATPDDLLCDDTNECTSDTCSPADPQAGIDGCIHPSVSDGSVCDDASVCTVTQSCQSGVCTGQQNLDCSDGASCTLDLCDAVDGCSNPGIDNDSDGYDICGPGDPANPDGFPKDCNDANQDVNPGATEDCFNSLDDDCNGLTDAADTVGCPRSDISGTITYYRTSSGGEPGTNLVADAELQLVGTTTGTDYSSSSGYYQFLDILKGLVSVIPEKTGEFANGISSLDASRISQYRVGLYTMTANQLIAADVSGNGSISSYDASLISQFRVGIITRFPIATLQDSDWTFSPVQRDYAPLDSDRPGEDYLGILYGDVTGNWAPSAAASPPPSLDSVSGDLEVTAKGTATAPQISANEASPGPCYLSLRPLPRRDLPRGQRRYALVARGGNGILGLDIDLHYGADLGSIESVSLTRKTSHFILTSNDAGGLLKVSMYASAPFQGDAELLEFIIHQKVPGKKFTFSFEAVANEGQILLVNERPPGPRGKER